MYICIEYNIELRKKIKETKQKRKIYISLNANNTISQTILDLIYSIAAFIILKFVLYLIESF